MSPIMVQILIAIVLWFAIGTYLNLQLAKIHSRMDRLVDGMNGLRDYLYEIDPQFDDERDSARDFAEGSGLLPGMLDLELKEKKREAGYRTLFTGFWDGSFRSPRDK